jgi:TolB-like protein
MNFFAELKRRNVYRVAIAYLIAAWLLLQFASTFVPILGLPGWVTRLIFLLLVIGLVPTLIAAWALELTPEGIKLEKDVDRSKSETVRTGRKLNYLIIGMLVLIIVGLVVERVFIAEFDEPPPVMVAEPDKSIAVLPFADFSQARDQEWFADGLAEEILNALARTPDIMVSSRTSAFAYKGTDKDLSTIARELGVAHVLEGSIRSTGERIRVTAQLIRAADGFHLWSQTYDSDAGDVIGIQEDVSLKIASALQTTMDPEALQDMMRVGTRSVRAYQAYIRALALRARWNRTGDRSGFQDSYAQFELARNIDPRFAAAHREAAAFWKVQLNPTRRRGGSTDLTTPEILDNFLERIDLAIDTATDSIDESGSRAQKAAVQLRLRTAIRRYRVYVEARPNDYRAWYDQLIIAQLAADRETTKEAMAVLKKAGEVDRFAANMFVSTAYRFEDPGPVADYGLEALERWPNDAGLSYQTHRSLLWAMRIGDAASLVGRMNETNAGNPVVRARQACAEGRRDDVLQILQLLRSVDGGDVAAEWVILMLLGAKHEATELLQVYESGEVPYEFASWLIYHHFDPNPFPSLVQMLERENVQRPPAAEIPFACPPD